MTALLLTTLVLSACAEKEEVLQPDWTWEFWEEVDGGPAPTPHPLVFADDTVWVAFPGEIRRLRADDGDLEAEVLIEGGTVAAMTAAADGRVWAAVTRSPDDPTAPAGTELVGIDPASNTVTVTLPTGLEPGVEILDIAVLDEVWITTDSAEVIAIDPATGAARRILKSVTVPDGLVAADGKIWMLRNASVVTALDPVTGKATLQRDLPGDTENGEQPRPQIASTDGSLWIARLGQPPIVVLDAETGEVTDEITLPDGWAGGPDVVPVGDRIFLTHGQGEHSLLEIGVDGAEKEHRLAGRQYLNLIAHGDAFYMTVYTSQGAAVQRYTIPEPAS